MKWDEYILCTSSAGWKHCPTCQLDAPPRSHHCNHCGHCILKRDHHCFFTAACVGFYNQRHYVMFCIYVIWGCVLGIYLQLSYVSLTLPLPENYIMYVAPVTIFQFLIGNLSLMTFILVVHAYFHLFFLVVTIGLLAWQMLIIVRGQTSHEAWKMIRIYNSGVYSNFTSVFGSPLLSWVLFFMPLMLPLEGDGIKWNIRPKPQKGLWPCWPESPTEIIQLMVGSPSRHHLNLKLCLDCTSFTLTRLHMFYQTLFGNWQYSSFNRHYLNLRVCPNWVTFTRLHIFYQTLYENWK